MPLIKHHVIIGYNVCLAWLKSEILGFAGYTLFHLFRISDILEWSFILNVTLVACSLLTTSNPFLWKCFKCLVIYTNYYNGNTKERVYPNMAYPLLIWFLSWNNNMKASLYLGKATVAETRLKDQHWRMTYIWLFKTLMQDLSHQLRSSAQFNQHSVQRAFFHAKLPLGTYILQSQSVRCL